MVYGRRNLNTRPSNANRNTGHVDPSNGSLVPPIGSIPPPPYDGPYRPPPANLPQTGHIYPDIPSENEPLLPNSSSSEGQSRPRKWFNKASIHPSSLKLIMIIVIFGLTSFSSFYVGYQYAQRDVRRSWMDLEYEKQAWARTQNQELLQLKHQKEIWARKREDEELQLERDRESWNEKRRQEQLQLERAKESWDEERRREQLQLEKERNQIRGSRRTLERDRAAWTDERRRREEDEKRDVERRQRAGLAWIDLEPEETCLAYGKRNYRAKLTNLPEGVDGVKWCHETPMEILGVTHKNPRMCSVYLIDISSL
jgi:hypothetical protein